MVFLTIVILVFSLIGCSTRQTDGVILPPSVNPASTTITIDPETTFQEMKGFGVSGRWWAQIIGGWQENNRNRVVKLLFDPSEGIGLTMMRYNIGAGGGAEIFDPWRRTESFERTKGIFDWDRDENAVQILQLASEVGVKDFVASANSPPPRLTRTGKVTGGLNGASNLGFNQEQAYAEYLFAIVKHLVNEMNIPIKWISPAYEPEKEWGQENEQEGCHFTPKEYAITTAALQQLLIQENLDIDILVPETGTWSASINYLNAIDLLQHSLAGTSRIVAAHSFGSGSDTKTSLSNLFPPSFQSANTWMTEWGDNANSQDFGIQSALNVASSVQEDITLRGVSSWHYSLGVSKYRDFAGLIHTNPGTQTIIVTKRLWGFGNYSRYIHPGDRVILATVSEPGLKVSAFTSNTRDRITLVVVNPTTEPIITDIEITSGSWLELTAQQTSENHNLEQVYKGAVPESFLFNGQTITTLIISP